MAKPPNELPTQVQFNRLRAWLLSVVGMTGQEVNAMIGTWGDYARGEIANRMTDNQRGKNK